MKRLLPSLLRGVEGSGVARAGATLANGGGGGRRRTSPPWRVRPSPSQRLPPGATWFAGRRGWCSVASGGTTSGEGGFSASSGTEESGGGTATAAAWPEAGMPTTKKEETPTTTAAASSSSSCSSSRLPPPPSKTATRAAATLPGATSSGLQDGSNEPAAANTTTAANNGAEKPSRRPRDDEEITIVTTPTEAWAVLDDFERILQRTLAEGLRDARGNGPFFACDTEVVDLDLKKEGPVGNGRVICASIYCGFEASLGIGPARRVWVDNAGAAAGTLDAFKDFFEDECIKKVWHNYSFDRHVLYNEGINCRGFWGDTLHMARLLDTSRVGTGKGYSLESLSGSYLSEDDGLHKTSMKDLFGQAALRKDGTRGKTIVMPDLEVLQLGSDGLLRRRQAAADAVAAAEEQDECLPPPDVASILAPGDDTMTAEEADERRGQWIHYSVLDAEATYHLRDTLQDELSAFLVDEQDDGVSMYDWYMMHYLEFGELLTDIERVGINLDVRHLQKVEKLAEEEIERHEAKFRQWASGIVGGDAARVMNIQSPIQKQHLLFAGWDLAAEDADRQQRERGIMLHHDHDHDDQGEEDEDSKEDGEEKNRVMIGGAADPDANSGAGGDGGDGGDAASLEKAFKVPNIEGWNPDGKKVAPKNVEISLQGFGYGGRGMMPSSFTPSGRPQLTGSDLEKIAGDPYGDPPSFGAAYDYLTRPIPQQEEDDEEEDRGAGGSGDRGNRGKKATAAKKRMEKKKKAAAVAKGKGGRKGKAAGGKNNNLHSGRHPDDSDEDAHARGVEACEAFASLVECGKIQKMLSTFIRPLQGYADNDGRVHCSLNINTETGRLSSRMPNLQNQPALEKDRYRVRDAFAAAEDQLLIVADYSQLELRVMAHMTKCQSMIDAFHAGGDFHSRTAMGMYPETVGKAVQLGEVVLDKSLLDTAAAAAAASNPDAPLLKDVFAQERRAAKILNFSIAYGKTTYGLAKDFGVSVREAEKTVNAWYSDRPEVRSWQEAQRASARERGFVTTMMHRTRRIIGANSKDRRIQGSANRMAINAPIQGTAADIVMRAMIALHWNEQLSKIGWRQVLQIHDEIVLEGPAATAEEARQIVHLCMEHPFGDWSMAVDLNVDSHIVQRWGDAK